MKMQKVPSHRRGRTFVHAYTRKPRPKGKKRTFSKAKYVAVRDEYGRILGYKPARGR